MCDHFIIIDGPSGSGKSAVAKSLQEKLNEVNERTIITKEPGGTKFGMEIKKFLIDNDFCLSDEELLLSYMLDQSHHLHDFIIPTMLNRYNVITECFIKSVYVKLHELKGISKDKIDFIYNMIYSPLDNYLKDKTHHFILDVNLDTIKERIVYKNKAYINESSAIKEINGFSKTHLENEIHLNANKSIDEIVNDIYNILLKRWDKS